MFEVTATKLSQQRGAWWGQLISRRGNRCEVAVADILGRVYLDPLLLAHYDMVILFFF